MERFNIELGLALRQFIAEPDNFLRSIALVNSMHMYPVLASSEPYAIAIDGQKLTPVFTSTEDLETFCHEHPSASGQEWIERSALDVLEEVILHQLSGLIFNVKREGDFSNSTIFKSSEMIQFVNAFTQLINDIMSDENQAADLLEKVYLVPVFIYPKENGTHERRFPTMANELNQSFVPVFSSLPHFADWYNNEEFGLPFREMGGSVFVWKLEDILQKDSQEAGDTLGVVVNPLAEQQAIVEWNGIDA
ncbi:SseB family protein [Streptococcus pluranimalium]